jgi:ribulose 1,5-bisphosphate synthetase/thiazole synthase
MSEPLSVAIAGAGLSGLCLAQALLRAGFDSRACPPWAWSGEATQKSGCLLRKRLLEEPAVIKFDHLRIPVTNLGRSRDWYVSTLRLNVEFEVTDRQRRFHGVPSGG